MRIVILFILIFISSTSIFGQVIELTGAIANSNYYKYKTNAGYGLGYVHYIKAKSRLGISIAHSVNKTDYDHVYGSLEDGVSVYIKQIEPDNHRIAVKINYAYILIDNPKSRLYLGPEIGLNYYMIRENYDRIENGYISGGSFSSNDNFINRLGIGIICEIEINEIIYKRLSTFFSINPEIGTFEKNGLMGSYYPYHIGWINFSFGIRCKLTDNNKACW